MYQTLKSLQQFDTQLQYQPCLTMNHDFHEQFKMVMPYWVFSPIDMDMNIRWIANWPVWPVACCVADKGESFTLEIPIYLWRL